MIGFLILSLVMIASAVFTVTARRPVHSVVGLLVNFIALAITYLTLHAEFLAVMQIVAIGLVAIVITAVRSPIATQTVAGTTGEANAFGSVADFGIALFTRNLLPFEVTAFVLMVAIIGVVLLAGDDVPPKRSKRGTREPIVRPVEREPIAR